MVKKILTTPGWLVIVIYLFGSCKKDPMIVQSGKTAGITFFNASTELNYYLTSHMIPLFWDQVDTTQENYYKSYYSYSSHAALPQFDNTAWDQMFPSLGLGNYQQPWQEYWSNVPGDHKVIVADTAWQPLDTIPVQTSAAVPKSLFITDSLGIFRSVLLDDDVVVAPNTASFRFINLSPDAGDVLLTINQDRIPGLSEPVAFAKYHNYVPVPVTPQDTLVVRLYSVGDTTAALSQVYMTAYPGHAYTLYFSGYTGNQTYQSSSGVTRMTYPASLLYIINSK